MASQFLTVALVVGESSAALSSTLLAWASSRSTADPTEVCPTQWPSDVHTAVNDFVETLACNADGPPVAYYSRHVDTWTMGDVLARLMQPDTLDSPVQIQSNRYELWARTVLNGDVLASHAAELSLQFNDTPEYQWVANRIREAALSSHHDLGHATIILIREVTGGLVSDDERMLDTVAPWIPADGG